MPLNDPRGPLEYVWSPLEELTHKDPGLPGGSTDIRKLQARPLIYANPLPSISKARVSISEEDGICERRQEEWSLGWRDDGGGVRGGFLWLTVLIVWAFSESWDDPDHMIFKVHLLLLG